MKTKLRVNSVQQADDVLVSNHRRPRLLRAFGSIVTEEFARSSIPPEYFHRYFEQAVKTSSFEVQRQDGHLGSLVISIGRPHLAAESDR
jgi:hypothetical protein